MARDFDKEFVGKTLIGVDEVGVAPLAGPVVACAAIVDAESEYIQKHVTDSKKMTETMREEVFHTLTLKKGVGAGLPKAMWALAEVSHTSIDMINIKAATERAQLQAVMRLQKRIPNWKEMNPFIVVDGNDRGGLDGLVTPSQAYVKGDQQFLCIGAASIIAKVCRDRLMKAWHWMYPEYNFAKNKGYPTGEHLLALNAHGFCPIHRQGFSTSALKNFKKKLEEEEG